jgi:uncharacterized protein (DUF1501 family)
MHRRQALRALAGSTFASVGAFSPWRLWAAPAGTSRPRLLVVFLRGACDGLSVLVPYADDFYYESRPTLAIGRPRQAPRQVEAGRAEQADAQPAQALDERWGLHPSLVESIGPWWASGELAFVPFAGTDFVSRSHFQAQDWIEFGQGAGQRLQTQSGFLNRLMVALGGAPAPAVASPPLGPATGVAFTGTLPASMRGPMGVVNAPVSRGRARGAASPAAARALQAYEDRLLALYAGHPLHAMVREGVGLRRELSQELQQEMEAASRGAVAASGFALEAHRIGRLLSEQLQYTVGFLDVGGWDTHAGQGGATGALASRLRALGEGLAALADGLGPTQWRRTVVVVMSEFGRTFRENGTRGTDHGHGNVLWVMGGAVRGGRVRGEQAPIAPGHLHQDRDLHVLNENRQVLAGLFARMYGLGPEALSAVLPGTHGVDLGLV